MTQLQAPQPAQTPSRRTLLKTAAWATPVISIAVAAPLAAASLNDATVALVGDIPSAAASRPHIDGTGGSTSSRLVGPKDIRIVNGNGAVPGPITGRVDVTYLSDSFESAAFYALELPGFGPSAISGASLTSYSATTAAVGTTSFGFPITTLSTSREFTLTAGQVGGNTDQLLAITWGTTAGSAVIFSGARSVTYTVVVTLYSNGTEFDSDSRTLTVRY